MDITVKALLREVHPMKGFVYQKVEKHPIFPNTLLVEISARQGSQGECSKCGSKGACYDHKRKRCWNFIPLWGYMMKFTYALRRIDCRHCGPTIERVPWAKGKNQNCDVFRVYLAQWARLLSWAEVAKCFQASWADVYHAVEWVVDYGLKHRDVSGVTALGIDEIHVGKKEKFWTLIYQIDQGCKRLLWIGQDRKQATVDDFFESFGQEFCKGILYICSDMWKPYLNSARDYLPNVLHILDRFHIVKKLNEAIDTIRREEVKAMAEAGLEPLLKKMRWVFLKKRSNWTENQRQRMRKVEGMSLRTLESFLLVEAFQHFWTYISPTWAGKFMDAWCVRICDSNLEPLKKVAQTLKAHRTLLLNYFKAKKAFSSGVVEGLNAKVKLTLKRSYGFRTENARKVALYHTLGKLPEPKFTHRFF